MTTPFEVFRSPLTLYRYSSGGYVDGRYVQGTETPIAITASIQPTTGEDMQMVPEARRDEKTYALFTSYPVKTVGAENPDQIEIFGDRYELIQVLPWQNNSNFGIINHFKFIALWLDPLTAAPEPPP